MTTAVAAAVLPLSTVDISVAVMEFTTPMRLIRSESTLVSIAVGPDGKPYSISFSLFPFPLVRRPVGRNELPLAVEQVVGPGALVSSSVVKYA